MPVLLLFCSFQGSPCEDRNFRSDVDDTETEEASFSGQDDSSDNIDILEWAKVLCLLLNISYTFASCCNCLVLKIDKVC